MALREKQFKPTKVILSRFLTPASISEALSDLKKRGYQLEFRREAACLYCIDLDHPIGPESFMIDECYHFEDISNPDRDRMLYAISTRHGLKGFLVDASFVYEDNISPQMTQKLKWE